MSRADLPIAFTNACDHQRPNPHQEEAFSDRSPARGKSISVIKGKDDGMQPRASNLETAGRGDSPDGALFIQRGCS